MMNLALGIVIVLLCTLIQCATIAGVRRAVQRLSPDIASTRRYLLETAVLSSVVSALFFGMLVQVFVWAIVFVQIGELSDFRTAVYFSLVNFTTLGYGDIVLSESRDVLGPMEASNGVLMLGLSTSFLYSVMEKLRLDRSSN